MMTAYERHKSNADPRSLLLRALRKTMGLSLEEVAAAIRVSTALVRDEELLRGGMGDATRLRLVKFLLASAARQGVALEASAGAGKEELFGLAARALAAFKMNESAKISQALERGAKDLADLLVEVAVRESGYTYAPVTARVRAQIGAKRIAEVSQ
jgi:transcriptional regulator with XRE-family HTH domain